MTLNSILPETATILHKGFIFIAEDDMDDAEFLTDALKDLMPNLEIHIANSGKKANSFLENLSDHNLPGLIILDYNLPEINGREILFFLQQNEKFSTIPKLFGAHLLPLITSKHA